MRRQGEVRLDAVRSSTVCEIGCSFALEGCTTLCIASYRSGDLVEILGDSANTGHDKNCHASIFEKVLAVHLGVHELCGVEFDHFYFIPVMVSYCIMQQA